jgi:hypothetical protein
VNASLIESSQLNPEVPLNWLGIIEDLQRFTKLIESTPNNANAEEAKPLVDLHQSLFDRAEQLVEHQSAVHISKDDRNRVMAGALEMTTRLEFSTMFAQRALDTYGSKTLHHFKVDWTGNQADLLNLHEFFKQALGLSASDLQAMEDDIEERLADARLKAQVVGVLREAFELSEADPQQLRSNIKRLSYVLYPDCNLTAEEIEIIVIGTAVFLCIPFDQDKLDTDRFRALSPKEQQPIRQFLRRVNHFKPRQFRNFPVFGFLDGETLDDEWVEYLAELSKLSTQQIRDEVSRLVGILPAKDVDKFIVHDVWGHIWQSAMLDFEDMYQEMGKYCDHLDWNEQAASLEGQGIYLRDCFSGTSDDFVIDPSQFLKFVHGEVLERIPVTFSANVAEMVADVAEYKFIQQNPDKAIDMPSSSHMKECPTKFDLLVPDINLYFNQATNVFKLTLEDEIHRETLKKQMIEAGASEQAADRALDEMKRIWRNASNNEFKDSLAWEVTDAAVKVNLYTKITLNFLGFHWALTRMVRRVEMIDTSNTPLRGLHDLVILAVSLFFEQNRSQFLWHLDEYLDDSFVELCQQLVDFLRAKNTASPG